MTPGSIGTRLLSLGTAGLTELLRIIGVLCLSVIVLRAQQDPVSRTAGVDASGLRRTRVNVVASSKMFLDVNPNDARAALKVWFDTVGRRRGFLLDSRIDIVDDATEIRRRLRNHTADVIIPTIAEYLELEGSGLIVPDLTLSLGSQEGARYSYLLLVGPSSTATTVANLKGANLLVSSRGGSNTASVWLDVLLGKARLGRARSFFASVKAPAKAQACILPLFFGTADACVVDEVSLNMAKELNPQLGRMKVLARSVPMIDSVVATPVEPHPHREELLNAIVSLHADVTYRQLLMVFKAERIVRIQPGDLDAARELWRDYYRLSGSTPPRGAESDSAPWPSTVRAAESGPGDSGKGGH